MKKLHPRAVWMFFFRYLLAEIFLLIFLGGLIFMTILAKIAERNRKLPPAMRTSPREAIIDFLGSPLLWIILIFVGLIIFNYIWARLSYYFYRYELTDISYRAERGVIWKRYVSIPYERIQNVDIYRGIIARILGLSDIHIQTAGISAGGKGMWAEGRLPGLSIEKAEEMREGLIRRVKGIKEQGL